MRSGLAVSIAGRCGFLLVSLLACATRVVAQTNPVEPQDPAPVVVAIAFEGNETTRAKVMLREMPIHEGDPVDAKLIERSRQAILDLGLFRSVEVRLESVEGGQRVVFSVKEKWYLLPYPRLSANADGQNSVGAELRWNNLWGLNHSFRMLARSRDARDSGRGRELSYRASYRAPLIFDSPYGLNLAVAHSTTPVTDPVAFEEQVDDAEVLVSRRLFEGGPASQGWTLAGGMLMRRQDTIGAGAPAPYGRALAAVTQLDYRDVRFKIFSDEGVTFSTRYEIADRHYGSDYSYTRLTADFARSLSVGVIPHQTFEYEVHTGIAGNGPAGVADFSLGGAAGLRGYPRKSFEGDFYYLVGVEYLRPLHWHWLRLALGIEAGNVHAATDRINGWPKLSANIGLRARFPRFVNFEIEAGFAMPIDGGGGRIYGDRGDF